MPSLGLMVRRSIHDGRRWLGGVRPMETSVVQIHIDDVSGQFDMTRNDVMVLMAVAESVVDWMKGD